MLTFAYIGDQRLNKLLDMNKKLSFHVMTNQTKHPLLMASRSLFTRRATLPPAKCPIKHIHIHVAKHSVSSQHFPKIDNVWNPAYETINIPHRSNRTTTKRTKTNNNNKSKLRSMIKRPVFHQPSSFN